MGFIIENGVLTEYIEEDGVTEVVIREGVTEIGAGAFWSCQNITDITFPKSLIKINNGDYSSHGAFEYCRSLTSVTLPEGVTEIGERAFENCKSLTSINIPESVTEIGKSAFGGCESLTSITVPDSVTKISNSAFSSCKSLTSINIPESVTEIGESAFWGCESLTSITIPESVTEIGNSAFSGCKSLTSITVPDSVTEIGKRAFSGCESLTSINIPESVTKIGNDAFSGCESLASITLPESVTEIGESAFRGCKSLTSISIPESVTVIGYDAFDWCEKISVLHIPASVTRIMYGFSGHFGYMRSLAEIIVAEDNPEYTSKDGVLFNKDMTELLSYPSDKPEICYTVPESLNYIAQSAFYVCNNLEKLVLHEGIQMAKEKNYAIDEEVCSSFRFNNALREIEGIEPDMKLKLALQTVYPDVWADKMINGNAETRRNYLDTINNTSVDIIAQKAIEMLGSMKYTKKHLSNLLELFQFRKSRSYGDHEEPDISAKTYAAFYKMLIEKKADKCLEAMPIALIARKREEANDPDAGLLTELMNAPSKTKGKSKTAGAKQFCVIEKNILKDFLENSGLTEVKLPANIKSIYAFSSSRSDTPLPGIKKLIIPKSVEKIYGLDRLTDLEEIEVAPENPYFAAQGGILMSKTERGLSLYRTAKTVKKLVIPKVCNNHSYGFKFNEYEEITVEEGSEYYEMRNGYLLHYSGGVPELELIPSDLEEIIIPDGVESLSSSMFNKNITSVIMPDSVKNINYHTFEKCTKLHHVKLSAGLKCIGGTKSYDDGVFEGCTSLEEIEIPEGVEVIGKETFKDCTALRKVKLPSTLTKICEYAFCGCTALKDINIPGDVEIEYTAFRNSGILELSDGNIYYAWNCPVSYVAEANTFAFKEGTTELPNEFFNTTRGFDSVYIPASMEKLRPLDLAKFKSITVAEDNPCYASLDGVLFNKDMTELLVYPAYREGEVYNIPEGVIKIHSNAFSYSSNLNRVIIPEGVTEIEHYAFKGNTQLTDFDIPYTVTKIGSFAFTCRAFYVGRAFTHYITLRLYHDDAYVYMPLYDNWGQNKEESILQSFFESPSQANFAQLKNTEYKIPLAIFRFFICKDVSFLEYVKRHFYDIRWRIIKSGNSSLILKLLESGLVTNQNIDEFISFAIENNMTDVYMQVLNYKNDVLGFKDADDEFKL